MTGYGKAASQSPDFLIDVAVKAVNGRYLEIKFHGPKVYHGLEAEIRKKISAVVKRGTFDIYINRRVFNGSENILFNKALAKKWLKGFNEMAKSLNLEPDTRAEILFQVPELMKVEENHTVSAKEKKALFTTLDEAVKSCASVRASEGKTLKKDVSGHIKSLSGCVAKIKKLRGKINKELVKKFETRLEKLDFPGEIDEQRIAQEVVMQVDKTDINEEVSRLEAHFEAINQLISTEGSIGKKLDFYAQELLREVNTIGSKASHSQLTQLVVECKGYIEKYREQVQNVE